MQDDNKSKKGLAEIYEVGVPSVREFLLCDKKLLPSLNSINFLAAAAYMQSEFFLLMYFHCGDLLLFCKYRKNMSKSLAWFQQPCRFRINKREKYFLCFPSA